MDFIKGRDMIHGVLDSDRSERRKNFIIHQILWKVADTSVADANALIRHFDLYLYANGGMTCFDGPLARDIRPLAQHELDIVGIGDKLEVSK